MYMSLNKVRIKFKYGLIRVVVPIKTISYYLNNPGAIFVAMNGDIYVDNGDNHNVQVWTPNAAIGTIVMNVE